MTRKDFLKTAFGGILGTLFYLGFENCASSTTPETPGGSNTNQKIFTSTSNSGHTHTITIQKSEVESPPAAGITRNVSSSGGHTHSFSMTQSQLQSVNNGGSVEITDSVSDGHTHKYTISKWF